MRSRLARCLGVTAVYKLPFIAFNFTISADLPRLGYLTLMDTPWHIVCKLLGRIYIRNATLLSTHSLLRDYADQLA